MLLTTLDEVLAELKVPIETITVGRVPAAGASSDGAQASHNAHRLMKNPQWFASHGAQTVDITREACLAMKERGAISRFEI